MNTTNNNNQFKLLSIVSPSPTNLYQVKREGSVAS
jgi:hypothetical protein